jgi:hypothetical protein
MPRGRNYKSAYEFYRTPNPVPSSNISNEPYEIQKLPPPPSVRDNQASVKMDWETVQGNTANPDIWGPAFWFTVHNGASKYPIKASPIVSERMKAFILGMPVMIPCQTCKEHATSFIEAKYADLDDICSTRQKVFGFFVDFHNKVNKRYNKPILSYDDAYKLYSGEALVSKLSYQKN